MYHSIQESISHVCVCIREKARVKATTSGVLFIAAYYGGLAATARTKSYDDTIRRSRPGASEEKLSRVVVIAAQSLLKVYEVYLRV